MQLHAASIGEAVPRDNFDARIQSVFDSAVNLRLANEDRLITVLLSDHYELPQGIRIVKKDISLQSLTVGLQAASRGGILRFDSSPFAIDLRGAQIWRCRVRELNIDMSLPTVQKAWSTSLNLLTKGQRLKSTEIIVDDLFQIGTGSVLSQRMSKPVMQLIKTAEQFEVQGSAQAAERMIGLGPGVTPSGDDILIGFLAGLWSMAGQRDKQLSYVRLFGNEIIKLAKQTSEISRTYLYHATQGQFSSSLSTLAEAIRTGKDVEHATGEAMRVGHSSGMDSVTGLLIGLCVWNNLAPATVPGGDTIMRHLRDATSSLRKEMI
jgi:hypothetical protein